jgi:hypothetical protein
VTDVIVVLSGAPLGLVIPTHMATGVLEVIPQAPPLRAVKVSVSPEQVPFTM